MNRTIEKAVRFMEANTGEGTFCIISQKELDGSVTSSPITAAKVNGINEVYFGTGLSSNKVARISLDPRTSVCFATEAANVTLNGKMEVMVDPEVKKAVWYEGLEGHFTGPEDSGYCVLKLTTKDYKMMIGMQEIQGVVE